MSKKLGRWIFLGAVLLMLGWGSAVKILAADPGVVTLEANHSYTEYDITGDGKADKIRIYYGNADGDGDYQKVYVSVNDKVVYKKYVGKYDYFSDCEAQIYTISGERPLLYLHALGDAGVVIVDLLRYQSGKLKGTIDFDFLYNSGTWGFDCEVLTASGNTIYTEYVVQCYTFGIMHIGVNYTYKSGKVQRAGNTFTDFVTYNRKSNGDTQKSRTFHTNKKITVYTTVKCKKKAFKIPKGKAVYVRKIYCNGKKTRFEIRYKGKYGWIKPQTKYYYSDTGEGELFKEPVYGD